MSSDRTVACALVDVFTCFDPLSSSSPAGVLDLVLLCFGQFFCLPSAAGCKEGAGGTRNDSAACASDLVKGVSGLSRP